MIWLVILYCAVQYCTLILHEKQTVNFSFSSPFWSWNITGWTHYTCVRTVLVQVLISRPTGDGRKQAKLALMTWIVTFCVSRRRRKMYCGHARLCVCLSVCVSVCLSAAIRPYYCTDPDVTWGHGRGCPLVVHYWADLQSVHGLRYYGNITRYLVTSLRPSRDMTT